VRIGIDLANNNNGKTFIRLSSRARNSVKIRSPPLYLVDPKGDLFSRECSLPIMLSETGDDLDAWHTFITEEFDDIVLLNFHDFDSFCLMDPPLPARFPR
jgi:hypothetical protein